MEYYRSIVLLLTTTVGCLAQPLQMDELAFGANSIVTYVNNSITNISITAQVTSLTNTTISWTNSGVGPFTYWLLKTTNSSVPTMANAIASGITSNSFNDYTPVMVYGSSNNLAFPSTTNNYIVIGSNSLGTNISAKINVKYLVPLMTSDTAPSGTVTASSSQYAGAEYVAFTRQYSDGGWSPTPYTWPQWIQYQFPAGISNLCTSYTIWGGGNSYNETYQFQGSTNGTTWTTLDSQTGIDVAVPYPTLLTVNNTNYYSYYRWYIVGGGVSGPNTLGFQLYGIQ